MPVAPLSVAYSIVRRPALLGILVFGILVFSYPGKVGLPIDRVAVGLLCAVTAVHFLFFKPKLRMDMLIVIPMLVLVIMGTVTAITNPYDIQTWSFLGNRFVVPLALYIAALIVFRSDADIRLFHYFLAIATAYLILISLFWLFGLNALVWPGYILTSQEGPPEHLFRARGPFLNALANGMAISLGVVITIGWFQFKRTAASLKYGFALSGAAAVFATLTRSAMLGFVGGAAVLAARKRRGVALVAVSMLALAGFGAWIWSETAAYAPDAIKARFANMENIEFRMEGFGAALAIVGDNPLFGCGLNQSHDLLPRYMAGYYPHAWIHNVFVEILTEQGVVGLLCYLLVLAGLVRAAWRDFHKGSDSEDIRTIRHVWLSVLAIYFINSLGAGMSYQYINCLVFAYAAITQNRVSLQRSMGEAA